MESIQQPSSSNKNKKLFKNVLILLGILILVGGVGFAYYDLRQTATQNNAQIKELSNKLDTVNSKVNANDGQASLNSQDLVLEGTSAGFHLDTEFISSQGDEVTYGKDARGYNTLYVDVEVLNKGDTIASVAPSSFKLKDDAGKTYALHTEAMQKRPELMGKQAFQSQELAPNEKAAGTIGFQVPSNLTQAKLYFNNKSYSVEID